MVGCGGRARRAGWWPTGGLVGGGGPLHALHNVIHLARQAEVAACHCDAMLPRRRVERNMEGKSKEHRGRGRACLCAQRRGGAWWGRG